MEVTHESETLYTILLEYRGGTYVSQIRAAGRDALLQDWALSRTEDDLRLWGIPRTALLECLADATLVALNDVRNVWFASAADTTGALLLIDVVATLDT